MESSMSRDSQTVKSFLAEHPKLMGATYAMVMLGGSDLGSSLLSAGTGNLGP